MSVSRRVLVSVYNKENLEVLAEILKKNKDIVISTGGTAKKLREYGLQVKDISEITHFPEVMGGRVKTLHPNVHMGLLARKNNPEDLKTLKEFEVEMFDVVIGNLYDFQSGLRKNFNHEQQMELIDIGGPSFLRAGAKSFERITVICDPKDYQFLKGEISLDQRKYLASKVFKHTAYYDSQIAEWLNPELLEEHTLAANKVLDLRYGENPQQKASWYKNSDLGLHQAQILQGKELSYNNLLDLDAALSALMEFEDPTVVSVKHTNPCGVCSSSTIYQALEGSLKADPMSVFGGIVASNRELGLKEAELIGSLFLECIVAPAFSKDAKAFLSQKKNLRLLQWPEMKSFMSASYLQKSIMGGYLIQQKDRLDCDALKWTFYGSKPDAEILESLKFAWKICAHLKSNAISLVSGTTSVGLGMGQVSRIDAVEQAFSRKEKFHPEAKNLVLASDAFFPFPDSIEFAHSKGVKWVIQPGGSIKDEEVISKARDLGVNMVFTGVRHFKH